MSRLFDFDAYFSIIAIHRPNVEQGVSGGVSAAIAIALQLVQSTGASVDFDLQRVTKPKILSVIPDCTGDVGEIVVCARNQDRHRLPLPMERAGSDLVPDRGNAGSAVAAITPKGRCGMFEGERRCSKAEAARYGYGQGRDPITLLLKLGTKLLDPDAD